MPEGIFTVIQKGQHTMWQAALFRAHSPENRADATFVGYRHKEFTGKCNKTPRQCVIRDNDIVET